MSTTWSCKDELSILCFMRRNDTAMTWDREPTLNDAQAAHVTRMTEYLAGQIAAADGWLCF
jgi:hypothetical protein